MPNLPKHLLSWSRPCLAAILGVIAVSTVGWAQPATDRDSPTSDAPVPRYEVRRPTGPIQIDGRIDESAWDSASPGVSLQFLWDEQTGAKQPTLARLLWDDEHLYVAYDVVDADITAVYTERDDPTYRDDAVEIFLNPLPEQIDAYYGLEMNARAVLYDYLMYDSRYALKRFDMEDVRVAATLRGTLNERDDVDEGWSLEVAIPWVNFEEMSEPPTVGAIWMANLNRWDGVPPDRRMSIWSDPLQPRAHPHFPARFGELLFVE